MLVMASSAFASGGTTYSSTQTLAVPPASNFAGQAGGDGWAIVLSTSKVYNVFHHDSVMQVACHDQTTAAACAGSPYTVRDAHGLALRTPAHPAVYLDQGSGKLYAFVTDSYDLSVGIACFDTTSSSSCGYLPLTAANQGYNGSWSSASDLMRVGHELYSFNYVYGTPAGGPTGTGAQNRVLCYDLSTGAACAGEPYAVGVGSGNSNTGNFPTPGTSAIGTRLIIPNFASTYEVGCFDTTTKSDCAGSWPVATASLGYYAGSNGGPYPLLDASGTAQGVCFPTGNDPCLGWSGSPAATPAGMASAVGATSGWNGGYVQIGPRVYVPNGNGNRVQCYDFSKSAGCANFPHAFGNLSLLYTVNPDPQRPTCLWVNADSGGAQIQSFDAYTGGACGAGATRVLTSQFIVNQQNCYPTSYDSLAITSPAPGSYTSGTVQFADAAGNPIPGVPTVDLDANGVADLSSLGFTSGALPQYIITLNGASTTQLTVKLTWSAKYDPSCVGPGADVTKTSTTTSTMLSDGTNTGNTLTVLDGTPVFDAAAVTGDQADAASGSVTYTFYSDSDCTSAAATETDPIGTPGSIPASAGTTLAIGKYWVVASYSGDAGNEPSASACGDEVLDVKSPDSTPPVTTSDAPTGWQTTATTVTLTATDDASGVAATYYTIDGGPTQTGTTVLVSGDGTHPITFWSVDSDGNVETANAAEVDIDGGAPTIASARSVAPNANGWNNTDVTVTFTCADAVSGIKTCSDPQTFGEGTGQSANGTAVDNAGNTASATDSPINVDETAPTLSGAATTAPNANGWYSGDVIVHWTCADDRSGVDGSCPADSTITSEGSALSTSVSISDLAGNSTNQSVTANIDRTAPAVTAAADRAPNANGWYNAPVTVTYACSDALSGVADCPAPQAFAEGTAQTASGTGHDKAGNPATASVSNINVDTTAPTLAPTVTPNAIQLFGTATVTPNAADLGGSGLGNVTCGSVDTSTVGTTSVSCTATDNAGNTTTGTATYSVYSALSYKQDALNRINALIPNASKNDAKQLSDAASKLQDAMTAAYWVDGIHLQPSGGVHVFNGEKQAIDKLTGIAGTQPIVDELVDADRILESVAVGDAIAANGNAAKIAAAQAEATRGNASLASGQYASGIAHLMNAWQDAEQAVGKL